MDYYNQSNNMLDYFTLGNTTQCDTTKCYFTSKSPEILDWSKEYRNNKYTDMTLKNIQKIKNVIWTAYLLKEIRSR